jgi:hypothetical protein
MTNVFFMKFNSGFYIVCFVDFDEVNSEFVGVTRVIYLVLVSISETCRLITVWLKSDSSNGQILL